MATTTFTAASLIFVNIWLVAFVSFGVIASSILLYILNAVDVSIGPSLGTAISCVSNMSRTLTRSDHNIGNAIVHLPDLAMCQRCSYQARSLASIMAELNLYSISTSPDSPVDNCNDCWFHICHPETTLSSCCTWTGCHCFASRRRMLDLQSSGPP